MGLNIGKLNITTGTASNMVSGPITVPTFTTATRPGSPSTGQMIFNSTEKIVEVYSGSTWSPLGTSGQFETWTDGTRPGSPATGLIGWNTTTEEIQVYDGTEWKVFAGVSGLAATGGNSTIDSGGYRYHVFTSNGTFTITAGTGNIEYIIVAGGGGGGGGDVGGGGGAGGFRTCLLYSSPSPRD